MKNQITIQGAQGNVVQGAIGIGAQAQKSIFRNPTLTGSGTNNINIIGNVASALGKMEEFSLFDDHIKKYEVIETTEDILLLSVVLHRLKSDNSEIVKLKFPTKITDKILLDNITESDRTRTYELRDYYSKKFLWWTLNEIRLTPFREDLKSLINSDGKIFKEKILPLAYRMPEFYDYDTSFDKLVSEHKSTIKSNSYHTVATKVLRHVKTLDRKRRHLWLYEYWFTDDNDNLTCIAINKDNTLRSLFNLAIKNPLPIEGLFSKKIRENKEYFVLEKYSFL